MGKGICNPYTSERLKPGKYEESLQNHTRTDNPSRNGQKTQNRYFTKEGIEKSNKHTDMCSALLITGEMQIKTT